MGQNTMQTVSTELILVYKKGTDGLDTLGDCLKDSH